MSNQDDQDWIDLLAGQSVTDADPETIREAQVFRAALLAHVAPSKDDTKMPYPAIWEKLSARLAVEQAAREQPITTRQHYDPVLAFAASILIVIIFIAGFNHDSRTKSELPCVNEIINLQPHTIAANLQKDLRAFSLPIHSVRVESGWRVKTKLPSVRPPALEEVLTRYDNLIVLPDNNTLCVNILNKKPA